MGELAVVGVNSLSEHVKTSTAIAFLIGARIRGYGLQTTFDPPERMPSGCRADAQIYSRASNECSGPTPFPDVPLKLEFKTGDKPFKNKKSDLSPAMQMKAKRLAAQSARTKK